MSRTASELLDVRLTYLDKAMTALQHAARHPQLRSVFQAQADAWLELARCAKESYDRQVEVEQREEASERLYVPQLDGNVIPLFSS